MIVWVPTWKHVKRKRMGFAISRWWGRHHNSYVWLHISFVNCTGWVSDSLLIPCHVTHFDIVKFAFGRPWFFIRKCFPRKIGVSYVLDMLNFSTHLIHILYANCILARPHPTKPYIEKFWVYFSREQPAWIELFCLCFGPILPCVEYVVCWSSRKSCTSARFPLVSGYSSLKCLLSGN
jgi:hypothetical protein